MMLEEVNNTKQAMRFLTVSDEQIKFAQFGTVHSRFGKVSKDNLVWTLHFIHKEPC